ncbi:DeoR/GlpR family DNA-binding transcription regulator [Jannaschia seohaensis]|uniref:DeoR family glycerol-3-phosphate regulon repressor n=1 Tax=Jannaschia seohaensis TaxID=475081 RepID=A0A2Y9C8Q7_9RHOB|nr:DeoR/GlpR family DNA-binding transcription regulator [Jannaschia seohaensis]PWJ15084.1 DeoR family glycerol-3-phosphate regulon repressor [Jannaschia seohaensis]SSA49933.1 DeoR family transcriptional regulator, glycerol-3-phosphate regulon repressor [Jannaschia seohaensis]
MLSQRQQKILTLIEETSRVRVEDLAQRFATTPQTIRKDLQVLADMHRVVRFHGGATLLGGVEYTPPSEREGTGRDAKRAIGAAVAARLPPTGAVFLNAGTTTAQAVRMMTGARQLRIIVDNVDLAAEIRALPGIEAVVPGGAVRRSDGAILGAEAVDYVRQFRPDYAVIGAAAVAEDGGLLDFDLAEVQVCRAMMAHARHVVLAVDSSKFSRSAPVRFGALDDVDTLVTDSGAPDWVSTLCARCEVDLVVVPV